MQLAGQKMLPEVLAAVVRAMSAARAIVAFEQGAVGPSKDCAYEGPIMKAIAGVPIAMEGKSAACAHFSPVGNIASAMCDLWSNEFGPEREASLGQRPGGVRRTAGIRLPAHECGYRERPGEGVARSSYPVGRMAEPSGGGAVAGGDDRNRARHRRQDGSL